MLSTFAQLFNAFLYHLYAERLVFIIKVFIHSYKRIKFVYYISLTYSNYFKLYHESAYAQIKKYHHPLYIIKTMYF